MEDTQVIGMKKRNVAADDKYNEIQMITVGKLGQWSSKEKVKVIKQKKGTVVYSK